VSRKEFELPGLNIEPDIDQSYKAANLQCGVYFLNNKQGQWSYKNEY